MRPSRYRIIRPHRSLSCKGVQSSSGRNEVADFVCRHRPFLIYQNELRVQLRLQDKQIEALAAEVARLTKRALGGSANAQQQQQGGGLGSEGYDDGESDGDDSLLLTKTLMPVPSASLMRRRLKGSAGIGPTDPVPASSADGAAGASAADNAGGGGGFFGWLLGSKKPSSSAMPDDGGGGRLAQQAAVADVKGLAASSDGATAEKKAAFPEEAVSSAAIFAWCDSEFAPLPHFPYL